VPLNLARQVDEVCDRFESQWLAGARPRIEAYIGPLPDALRPALLRGLLPVELELQRRGGEQADVEEYRRRFPEHTAIVDEAFRAAAHRSSVRAAPTAPHAQLQADAGHRRWTARQDRPVRGSRVLGPGVRAGLSRLRSTARRELP